MPLKTFARGWSMLLYCFVDVAMVQKAFPADISFAASWSAEGIMKKLRGTCNP